MQAAIPVKENNDSFMTFRIKLEAYFTLNDISDNEKKRAALISALSTYDLNKVILKYAPKPINKIKYDDMLDSLIDNDKKIAPLESFQFYKRTQRDGETNLEFLNSLKSLALKCNFKEKYEENLKMQIINGLESKDITTKLLLEEDMGIEEIEKLLRTMDLIDEKEKTKDIFYCQAGKEQEEDKIENKEINYIQDNKRYNSNNNNNRVQERYSDNYPHQTRFDNRFTRYNNYDNSSYGRYNNVNPRYKYDNDNKYNNNDNKYNNNDNYRYKNCIYSYDKTRGNYNTNNNNFKYNDNQYYSQTKKTCFKCGSGKHLIKYCDQRDKEEDISYIYSMDIKSCKEKFKINLNIEGKKTNMILDTGASVSIISLKTWNKINSNKTIHDSDTKLKTYEGNEIAIIGSVDVKVQIKETIKYLPLIIVKADGPSLVGINWIKEFRELVWKESILAGTENTYDNNNKIYYVEQELKALTERTHISEWASPLVPIVKPNGNIRLCIDYKITINPWMTPDIYPIPRIQEIFNKLRKGEKFSTIDFSNAYHQIVIDSDSRKYLAINTHKGLFQFKRMPFGITPASAIFQRTMDLIFGKMTGVAYYIDDLIITGS
ncbi:metacaspase-2-like [Gordionus sp. m RMFG-2023]|uniref:metacaspase-2-like n=1 Tax=Gordionus sp. m RMFG-2023 TaxID=3053472 RepID=UPI0031FD6617